MSLVNSLFYSFDLFSTLFCSADSGSDAVPPRLSGCAWAAEIRSWCSAPLDFRNSLIFPSKKNAVCQCASVPVCCFAVAVVLLVAVRRHRTLLHHKAAWSIHKGLKSAGGFIGPNYINFSFNHIQPYQKHSKTIAAIA